MWPRANSSWWRASTMKYLPSPLARLRCRSSADRTAMLIVFAQRDAAADDDHAALLGDVPQRGEPGLTAVPRRRDVDLHAPRVHGVACQGHVVLPTDEAAQPPKGRVVHVQRAAVALRPDEA